MEESPKLEEEVEEESNNGISEYEKQRLARIRENETRLQALGLPRLASSLLPSKKPKKSERKPNKNRKKKRHNDDDEYRPSDEESDGGANLEESEEEEEEVVGSSSISQRKGKRKTPSKATKMKKCSYTKIKAEEFNEIDDHTALQQAIALSLGEITEGSAALSDLSTGKSVKIDKPNIQETVGRRNNKKTKSRVQLTEDEVVAYFFTFDESGKGYVSLRDVGRMAVAHDFNWTEMEVASMIHSFDSDRDGKLSLEDFRTIVSRCNMMQEIGQIRQHDARDWTELSRV